AREEVELVVTPELSLTGYDLRDRTHALAVPLGERPFAALARGPDLVLGMVELGADFTAYNSSVHLRGDEVLHRHRKLYLPTYGMFDEGRFFGAGDRVRAYDAGGGWRIGLLVCEDLWHPALVYLLALGGAQLVIVQAAAVGRGIPAQARGDAGAGRFASARAWEQLACAAALAYGIYVVVANRVGAEGACVFGGGSLIVAPGGKILARGDDLAEDRPTADLSLARVALARCPFSHARDEDPHLVARELARLLEREE
ncbi:MAG TPA: nitrilase-related carbon-nitrogen hydrolase, partial [Longimicrobiaceae bacterium]|nr:nitrilase-related carbon-nitrogen hydrolase [Longimicrobiaceae bacterium]